MAPRRPTAFELSFGNDEPERAGTDGGDESEYEVEHIMLRHSTPTEAADNSLFPPASHIRESPISSARAMPSGSGPGSLSRPAVRVPALVSPWHPSTPRVASGLSLDAPGSARTSGRIAARMDQSTSRDDANTNTGPSTLSSVAAGKRRGSGAGLQANADNSRPEKRQRVQEPPEADLIIDVNNLGVCQIERENTLVVGEDTDLGGNMKPVRLLTHFVVFEPAPVRLVSLEGLLEMRDHRYEAAGKVGPVYENEEDAGQDQATDSDDKKQLEDMQSFRTTTLLTFTIDYSVEDGPLGLETKWAYYILNKPSSQYKAMFREFYCLHRITQLAISMAMSDPASCSEERFMTLYDGLYDQLLDDVITREQIIQAYPTIVAAVKTDDYRSAQQAPFIRAILSNHSQSRAAAHPARKVPNQIKVPSVGSIDLMVLRPENQNQTTVTPFVDYLSEGLFRERLYVLGPKLQARVSKPEHQHQKLLDLLKKAAYHRRRHVEFFKKDRLKDEYWSRASVHHDIYEIGDVVLVAAAPYPGRMRYNIPERSALPEVPLSHTIADYFWFAKIIYLNQLEKSAHVQWFEHSSKTMLQEIHDPHELFLTKICNDIQLDLVIAKVHVKYVQNRGKHFRSEMAQKKKSTDFYYSFLYNQSDGSFLHAGAFAAPLVGFPPDNCSVCADKAVIDLASSPQQVEQGNGVAMQGHIYHLNDFALFRSDKTFCLIGQIVGIDFASNSRARGACYLRVLVLGKVSEMLAVCPDDTLIKDEQHLFLTDEIVRVSASMLLQPCRVLHPQSLPASLKLEEYLSASPLHFYVTYLCGKNTVESWKKRDPIPARRLRVCAPCFTAYKTCLEQEQVFQKVGPLRAFDPFGGVGAFALAMQATNTVKLTHAVEISPSAAKTLKLNSPDTVVYNQCANLMLKEIIRSTVPELERITTQSIEGKPLPPLFTKEDVDCIIAGFPCQPHSTLNMYQKAHDRKSHLILNLLSWVDHLQPKYCFFENVRGFLQYSLNATQRDKYSVQDGIQSGGLKFFVHSLIAMGYQVRFALLNAAHYGTPQARVRFYLIAAKLDCILPSFPQPLYHIPISDSLQIRLPHGLTLSSSGDAVKTMDENSFTAGRVPFSYISIEDAIGDLAWFDWRNPLAATPEAARTGADDEIIPLLAVDHSRPTLGFSSVTYRHQVHTRFQKNARARQNEVLDLQHFTRPLKDEMIARVTFIPLIPGADFHWLFKNPNIPSHLLEWHYANPSSSVARSGFRSGLYGRLDGDKWFKTTVTNVEPTAKQSWVLNPWCKRVLTVRELARSQGFPDHFKFYSVTEQVVKTMHREIGNAVPWPVGAALGRELFKVVFKDWQEKRTNAIDVD